MREGLALGNGLGTSTYGFEFSCPNAPGVARDLGGPVKDAEQAVDSDAGRSTRRGPQALLDSVESAPPGQGQCHPVGGRPSDRRPLRVRPD